MIHTTVIQVGGGSPVEVDVPDTYIDSVLTTTNFGTGTTWLTGYTVGKFAVIYRALIGCNLVTAGIPLGANILSAQLDLYCSTAALTEEAMYAARCSYPIMTDGDEGAGWDETGCTWEIANASTLWTPGDDPTTPVVEWSLPTSTGAFTIPALEPIVQDCVDSRAGLLSMILYRQSESGFLARIICSSSEHATASRRPKFTIEWSVDEGLQPSFSPCLIG